MKHSLKALVVVLLMGVAFVEPALAASQAHVVNGDILQFGSVRQSSVIEHKFIVHNRGDEPLIVGRITTNCDCITTRMERRTIQPGSEEPLSITVRLAGVRTLRDKFVQLEVNDPLRKRVQLLFSGEILSDFEVIPDRMEFGVVPGKFLVTRFVKVFSADDRPLRVAGVRTSSQQIRAEVHPLQAGRAYRVTVTVTGPLAGRAFRGEVVLDLAEPKGMKVTIPVQGGPHSPLLVQPEVVVLNKHNPKPANCDLRIYAGSARSFTVDTVQTPGGPRVGISRHSDTQSVVRLKNLDPTKLETRMNVMIMTNAAGANKIEIPFRLVDDRWPDPVSDGTIYGTGIPPFPIPLH